MSPNNIIIKNASLAYKNKILFDHLNFTIKANQWTCLLGPSGVGKSTLLKMIAGLFSADSEFRGQITSDNNIPLSPYISYMAQTDLLMPWLTVLENTLIYFRLQNTLTAHIIFQAKQLLAELGLQKVMQQYPNELSGGMRQRTALARTLLQNKPIVLMDEPFSSLDAITRFQLQTLTKTLLRDKTVLLITHDPLEALRLADSIHILSGSPAQLNSPLNLTTPAPRDLDSPEVLKYQTTLFDALLHANENTL